MIATDGTGEGAMGVKRRRLNHLEICAGAGGQTLGLERAGYRLLAAVENNHDSCETLRANKPAWNVIEQDLYDFEGLEYTGLDLLSGGVPCQPFSEARSDLGYDESRDLFPEALRLMKILKPKACMFETVRGFTYAPFDAYRYWLFEDIRKLGYEVEYRLLRASDYGVGQQRPRCVIVAMKPEYMRHFVWPDKTEQGPVLGELIYDLMRARGWKGAKKWSRLSNKISLTLATSHGLGTGVKTERDWYEKYHVNAANITDKAPGKNFKGKPKLTLEMLARIQAFPDKWKFVGSKTSVIRQIGNAFPPPVAEQVGLSIKRALRKQ